MWRQAEEYDRPRRADNLTAEQYDVGACQGLIAFALAKDNLRIGGENVDLANAKVNAPIAIQREISDVKRP